MIHLAIYIIAALSCAITLTACGWSHSTSAGALACAVVALTAVAIYEACPPARLSAWHRARSRSLFERHASISSIFPMAVVAWLALVLLEALHHRMAEVMS